MARLAPIAICHHYQDMTSRAGQGEISPQRFAQPRVSPGVKTARDSLAK
jgi:hypothetical protein